MTAAGVLPALRFAVTGAEALAGAATPTIALELEVARAGGGRVRSATVDVRVDISPARRSYDAATQARLAELFGGPERWGSTLHGLGWARTTVLVGAFEDRTTVRAPLPCSYDFEVAGAKYLQALRDGEIPLDLLFRGSLLHDDDGRLQAAPIAWDAEASYRLPVRVWREAMDAAFGDSAWLRVGRGAFDRLYAFRTARALTSWDATLDALLEEASWTG